MAVVKPPRVYHHQMVHYIRKSISYSDGNGEINVGTLPAGALILKPLSGVHVTTVFNAAGSNVLDVGTNGGASGASDDPDLFATDLALGTATFVPLDEAVGGYLLTQDTNITCSIAMTGTAATTGAAEVVICYIPDNDG